MTALFYVESVAPHHNLTLYYFRLKTPQNGSIQYNKDQRTAGLRNEDDYIHSFMGNYEKKGNVSL